ncbi:3-ketoacyl-(acyl-carrier-protein) reductase [Gimesia alba]|uniref:3-ketoacyl-(Acyl-carrier-protein) reductase n=1 Tax=Gimesia alba TaxID=2527973 RepID=A0A517RIN9_9PLAN|nr:SDR family oxidoreductase [Gimesia alba]QDT43723.1 3-ketoacyl-(acyl-carrier-protein) reductase [Gimesia alba]
MDELKPNACATDNDSLPVTDEELAACQRVLQMLAERPELCLKPDGLFSEVLHQASLLGRRVKALHKKESRNRDRAIFENAGIREKRKSKNDGRYLLTDDSAPSQFEPQTLCHSRRCYICKQPYQQLHPFYDLMCMDCGDENFRKRSQTADLSGRTAIVTGGRVKIGFQTALKLLRGGARVLVTSRFPCDAVRRYAAENDFADWSDRLQISGCDFRSLKSVTQFLDEVQARFSQLDILINNASQTIRRPAAFYRHLLEGERQFDTLPPEIQSVLVRENKFSGNLEQRASSAVPKQEQSQMSFSAALSQTIVHEEDAGHDLLAFPPGLLDGDSQQIDLRHKNSWIQELGDVSFPELLEVHAVNSLVPFLLIQKLEPLLLNSPNPQRFIVNVSAMEGQLNTHSKTGFHPHTNMAKAGMNMVTRTSAERFAKRGIYMTSVDTGWITNEFPHQKTEQMQQDGFQPPLDEIDGAARVCDPVFVGINQGQLLYGKFLKDYRETNW